MLKNSGTLINNRHKLSVTFDDFRQGDFATMHAHWAREGVDWVKLGGTGNYVRYNNSTAYPGGSSIHTTVGNSHSPGDLSLPGVSIVVGRTGGAYNYGGGANTIGKDPFLRFFLFP